MGLKKDKAEKSSTDEGLGRTSSLYQVWLTCVATTMIIDYLSMLNYLVRDAGG